MRATASSRTHVLVIALMMPWISSVAPPLPSSRRTSNGQAHCCAGSQATQEELRYFEAIKSVELVDAIRAGLRDSGG